MAWASNRDRSTFWWAARGSKMTSASGLTMFTAGIATDSAARVRAPPPT